LQQIYSTENPDLLDLIGRVKAQEHGVDAHGNFLTSPAGAVGPMQVMPDTGPEAARLPAFRGMKMPTAPMPRTMS
jgi:hypothetical protein